MQRESAETTALLGLAWLLGNEELRPIFLGATGATLEDAKNGAKDADFLASVLDFLLMDDSWIMAFCESEGLKYEEPMAARQALPGGNMPNWT
ncbi:DUF3572 domain-containing protein [Tropicimonas sp. TH_r6]|uniref:DUF3572 domain-containing protein n=1 Tax=Tropicimonas sp. TH_r6 TaxID=3082085 RepID=UPI002955B6A4|nr:DUF3572 domain-containing protein [Tropicimonas sp. TH_r6]MDV7144234.1 DUF3572 domain-containing protein [Tropicimonas sp. TH_r6]